MVSLTREMVTYSSNIMAWKVSLDKLPTRLNLSLRGIEIPSITCPICSCARESCSHLFFSCSMAQNITTKLARWWEFDCPDLFSYDDWLEWFHTLRFLKGFKDILEGVFYVMWWVIWKYRNQTLFGSSQPRWICYLMRLYYSLLLGAPIGVKTILIGSLG
ncbi:RNA-directed DNA polymerase, eukaryota [Tanacetum coccineum]